MKLASILAQPMSAEDLLAAVRNRRRTPVNRQIDKVRALVGKFQDYLDRKQEVAGRALEGKLVLPGTGGKPKAVGNPPRWHDNPMDDNEYVHQLNRMGHWRPLCLAYAVTEEERYAEKVLQELHHWITKCPRPELEKGKFDQVDPWRCLEVGIRMFETWPWVTDFLLFSPAMTPELFSQYLISIHQQAEALSTIAPKLWPDADHNHYLMEMLGLLSVGCLWPELKESDHWREQARHELERCASAQLTSEGGQIEGCPHYHNGCAHWFLLAVVVGRSRAVRFSEEFLERVGEMLAWSLHALRPSGTVVPWGDSDADHNVLPAALYGWLALHRDAPMRMAADFVGRKAMRDCVLDHLRHVEDLESALGLVQQGVQRHEHPPLVSWQRELKQVAMRTNWTRNALSLFFACRTPVNNGHAHIDPMGFDFTALGKPLVVDPGRFTYREGKDRQAFKSAAWHNTLTIDGKDPFAYKTSWTFGPQERGSIKRIEEEGAYLAVEAEHHNYKPAIHRRLMAILDQRFLLILDHLAGMKESSTVQLNFHLDSPAAKLLDGVRGVASTDPKVRVAVIGANALTVETQPGRISDLVDHARPSTRVIFKDGKGKADRIYVTLIVPFLAEGPLPHVADLKIELEAQGIYTSFTLDRQAYRFDWFAKGMELQRL